MVRGSPARGLGVYAMNLLTVARALGGAPAKPGGEVSHSGVHRFHRQHAAGHRDASGARATRRVAGADRTGAAVAVAHMRRDSRGFSSSDIRVAARSFRTRGMHDRAHVSRPARHFGGAGRGVDSPRGSPRARPRHGRSAGIEGPGARRAHLPAGRARVRAFSVAGPRRPWSNGRGSASSWPMKRWRRPWIGTWRWSDKRRSTAPPRKTH